MRIRAGRLHSESVLSLAAVMPLVPLLASCFSQCALAVPSKGAVEGKGAASTSLGRQSLEGKSPGSKNSDKRKAPDKKVKVWTVTVSNPWANLTFRTKRDAVRIDGASGGAVIAKAPDWKVMCFHTKDKRARLVTIADWAEAVKRPKDIRKYGVPTPCTIVGIPALTYKWRDSGMGSTNASADLLFRGRTSKKEKSGMFITVAKGTHGLSPEVVEIWRLMMESQVGDAIALEKGNIYTTGQISYTSRVTSQKHEVVPISIYDYPQGYKFSREALISIFFGRRAEDMAEIFWGQ